MRAARGRRACAASSASAPSRRHCPATRGRPACPSRRTTFTQTQAAAYPRPELIEEFDSAGTLLRKVDEEYTINNTVLPYSTLNTATWTYVYEGAASKRTKVTRTFDVYGNARLVTQYGNFDVTGDEVLSSIVFAPNTTNYLVNYTGAVTIRAGADISAPIIAQTLYNYDGATNWNTPPVKGDLTQQQDLISTTTGATADTSAEYDAYGNVTASIDPVGNRTTFIYDPTYHLFVTEARDPLYAAGDTQHKTKTTWDYVCGLPLQVTDINNLNTSNQYDVLCRPTRTDTPGGGFVITSYHSIGTPTAQFIQTQTPPADGSGNLWSRSFLDGFGRTYQATAKGPSTAQIEVDTAFTKRVAIASVTAPFYVGDTAQTTSYKYDALDRKIEKQHPDSNKVQGSYGLSSIAGGFQETVVTDELVRPHTVHTDAYGRTIREERPLAGQPVLTDYQYDLLGNLTGLTDNAGNQWTYTYDSLGRRLTAADPDLGSWSYAYDAAGRLTLQTDALGQKTRLTYDELGRLRTKTVRADTPQAQTTTWTYDEPQPGFYNTGKLTTVANAAAAITYDFDAEGRPVGQTYLVDALAYSFASGCSSSTAPTGRG
jgi:YD repeat-containing protein